MLGLGLSIWRSVTHEGAGSVISPTNTVAPAITGTEVIPQTLSVTDGTWIDNPTSFTYQWYRAVTSGGNVVTSGGLMVGFAIVGATANTHILVGADYGERIYCEVTAINTGGSTMAQSNATGVIISTGTAVNATRWFFTYLN